MLRSILAGLIGLSITSVSFADDEVVTPNYYGTISTRCECVSNDGPDLMQIGFSYAPYTETWRTKINGWNNSSDNWNACFIALKTTPLCNQQVDYRIAKRCECVNNDGPDLMQIGYDRYDGTSIWKTKLYGWNSSSENWSKCYQELQTNSSCY
jgi:hypothetical protein